MNDDIERRAWRESALMGLIAIIVVVIYATGRFAGWWA